MNYVFIHIMHAFILSKQLMFLNGNKNQLRNTFFFAQFYCMSFEMKQPNLYFCFRYWNTLKILCVLMKVKWTPYHVTYLTPFPRRLLRLFPCLCSDYVFLISTGSVRYLSFKFSVYCNPLSWILHSCYNSDQERLLKAELVVILD